MQSPESGQSGLWHGTTILTVRKGGVVAVGGDGQVIVLTCGPQRSASVGGAHHIELTA